MSHFLVVTAVLALGLTAGPVGAQPVKGPKPEPFPVPNVDQAKLEKVRDILDEYAWSALQPAAKRIEIRRPLMEMGEDVFPFFEVILADPKSKPHIVASAIQILIVMKADRRRFVELVVARLADDYWGVRWKALVLLERIGSERDAAPVVALLSDKEASVRYQAAETLISIGGKREVVAMRAWLKSSVAFPNDRAYRNHVDTCCEKLERRLNNNPIPPIPKDLKN